MQRPTVVTILGGLAVLAAVWDLLVALATFGIQGLGAIAASGYPAWLGSSSATLIGGATVFGAIARLVFGLGVLQLKPWAWLLGVVLSALYALLYLLALGGGIGVGYGIGLVLSVIVLVLLFTPRVMEAFNRSI